MYARTLPSLVLILLVSGGCNRQVDQATVPPEAPSATEADPTTTADGATTDAAALRPEEAAVEVEWFTASYQAAKGRKDHLSGLETELDGFLQRYPDHPDGLMLMAQVYLEQERLDDSLRVARRCTEVDADVAPCWLALAVIEETYGNKVQARQGYHHYLRIAPEGRYARDARRAIDRLDQKP